MSQTSQGIATIKRLLAAISLLITATLFVALGFWQLDRAAEVKELQKPYKERPVIALSKVAQPSSNLSGNSVNRIVQFSGVYVAQFQAPNQIDKRGQVRDWLVGLMEVDGGGNILVVRSIENGDIPRGDISVTGRLFHRQYEDVSVKREGSLSRLDPSLLLAEYSGEYYDGFVLAQSESRDGVEVNVPRVELAPAAPTVPGYYWQHIAYVVIWWLMALVVLFLPFYGRWRERALARNEVQGEGKRSK